ncbi:hypothetical protein FGO68_gene7056 [Halteria grandinella]|uniref:Uncharacterized protein n=1 Tax=Halteria grandinella TaxID=5974 RepID=A0A8J8NQE1_HALGN|nr:hypothetical protein FGO68_gene7056 [Halteria grandinella]
MFIQYKIEVNRLPKDVELQMGSNQNKFNEMGQTQQIFIQNPFKPNHLVEFHFNLQQYTRYLGFWNLFSLSWPTERKNVLEAEQVKVTPDYDAKQSITVIYLMQRYGTKFTNYPDTLSTALFRIAGLLVFMKLATMVRFYNMKHFEKKNTIEMVTVKNSQMGQRPEYSGKNGEKLESMLLNLTLETENNLQENLLQNRNDKYERQRKMMTPEERYSFERIEKSVFRTEDQDIEISAQKEQVQSLIFEVKRLKDGNGSI